MLSPLAELGHGVRPEGEGHSVELTGSKSDGEVMEEAEHEREMTMLGTRVKLGYGELIEGRAARGRRQLGHE